MNIIYIILGIILSIVLIYIILIGIIALYVYAVVKIHERWIK